ncbi:MAG: ribonuclease HIII [Lentisphaeria bacterium]|nr:ribonuclease HIII [Lentisphaeria bacterium]
MSRGVETTMSGAKKSSFVYDVNPTQLAELESYLRDRGFKFTPLQYAHWKAAGEKLNIIAYLSGKLTLQGGNAAELVEFYLEPELLKQITIPAEINSEMDLSCHGGIDESGKGDFFGPLVIAGVVIDDVSGKALMELGVKDSKLIKSDKQILKMCGEIVKIVPRAYSVVTVGPESYNRIYEKIGNLNRLLAWGHARVIENLLQLQPECPRMLSDKFGAEHLIKNALLEKGRQIKMEQRTKAESDVAVAAASILARGRFVREMAQLAERYGMEFPKGGGGGVNAAGLELLAKYGEAEFVKFAKLHFKNMSVITGRVAAK